MDASRLFDAGKLTDAVDAALQHVKAKPLDIGGRFFLAELFCFQAEWERAEVQLNTITKQSNEDSLLAILLRQLICGEILREQVFLEGRAPQLVGELPLDAKLQLEICAELRNQRSTAPLIAEASHVRQQIHGSLNGQAFDDLRDLDDRIASVCEIITTTGKYYWVPWKSIKSLQFHAPERPADLLWRKASIEVEDGPEGDVYIPVRYPNPKSDQWDDQLRLGRATSWLGEEGDAILGLGQRMILVGDEAKAVMELDQILISQTESQ